MTAAPLQLDGTVLVVGASLAGLRAAETLRSTGYRGEVILIGEESHLPYDRPPLSKQVLAGVWPVEKAMLTDTRHLDELGVTRHLGRRAVTFDAEACRVVLDDGTAIAGDGVVLATGARARRLASRSASLADVEPAGADTLTLRSLDDAIELRQRLMAAGPRARVVVVGAGFIGSEVASTCSSLGCDVTVVEAAATPLALALGDQVGKACSALHERNGVSLRAGVGVSAIRQGSQTGRNPARSDFVVELADGSVLGADVVVVGIGVVPNVDWLQGSGLELADGIICDHALFASDRVVAAGDVARWAWRSGSGEGDDAVQNTVRIEHWQVAGAAGTAAARALLAGRQDAPPFDPVPYFWSDQYGVKIQMIGHPHPSDEVSVVKGTLLSDRFVALYGRSGRLTGVVGIGSPREVMAYRPQLVAGSSWGEALAFGSR